MNLQFPPYSLILFCAATVCFGLAVYALHSRHEKPFLYFSLMFIVAGTWPLIYAIELLILDTETSMFLGKMRAVPFQLFPLLLLIMMYQLVRRQMPPRWLMVTFSAFAAVQIFVMSTSDQFFNVWDACYRTTTPEGFKVNVLMPGLWLKFSLIAYHFAADMIALTLLFKGVREHKKPYKMQFSILAAAILLGVIVTLLFTYKIVVFEPYNPFPATILISSSLFAYAMFKYRLFNIIPYAKESVFDIIQNPVLIIDEDEKLIDYNPQARELFRLNSSMIGDDITRTFEMLNMDWTLLVTDSPVIIETRWGTGHNYKFSTLKKALKKDDLSGYIVVFSDITAQLDAMETKHEREILTYKESILGDMHDGIGGVVATAAMLAGSALMDEEIETKDKKLEQIGVLLENGSFELRSMLNILDKDQIDWSTLVFDMRSFSSTIFDARDINRRFSVDGSPYKSAISFEKYLSIFRLFKEIVINIIKHSQAENVTICLRFEQDKFRMSISDDGIGIDENKKGGYGLKNMKKRVENLNGTVEITSKDGTTVLVAIDTK